MYWLCTCTQRRWLGVARHPDGCRLKLELRATGYWLVSITRTATRAKSEAWAVAEVEDGLLGLSLKGAHMRNNVSKLPLKRSERTEL